MKKRNKDTRKETKRGGWLKWFLISFVALMFIGAMNSEDSDTTTTTTDNETEKVSSEVQESKQAEESSAKEEERLAKEEEERLEQESIEAVEKEWQEELDNARTDVTYENLMRTPDDYLGEIVKFSGTVIQTNTGDGIVQQRVALNDNYDQVVLIEYPENLPEVRLLDDDFITFTGMSLGTITYETVLGATLEIPSISVERINIE